MGAQRTAWLGCCLAAGALPPLVLFAAVWRSPALAVVMLVLILAAPAVVWRCTPALTWSARVLGLILFLTALGVSWEIWLRAFIAANS